MRIVTVILLLSAVLFAQRSGPYIGVGYGVGFYDSDDRLKYEESDITNSTLRFTLGAYINENFSVEMDYTHYDEFYGSYDGADVKESFSIIGVCALAHYPFYDDMFDIYGKIGAGQLFWNESHGRSNADSTGAYIFGGGLGYRYDEAIMIKIGYDLVSFGLDDKYREKGYDMLLEYFYTAFEYKF